MVATNLKLNSVHLPDISQELYKKNKEINETLAQTKLLAEQLSQEKKKIEIILENIIDIVIFIDENEKILLINKAFEREFELSKKSVINKPLSQIISFIDDQKILSLTELDSIIESKLHDTKVTKLIKISGNKNIYGTVGISVVANDQNKKRTILTIHNKTKEHELENMKLDFVSMAAHELRTPITSIRGYASLMSEELDEHAHLPIQDWKTLIGRISTSSEQLLALVENLLNVTKIEKGIMSLACKVEKWDQVVNESLEMFKESASAKKLILELKNPDSTLVAYVDKIRIEEVLNNLLSNAITYSTPNNTVTIQIKKDTNWIHTSIKDNGPGIAKSAQKHLFEKFFRVAGPLVQGSKGNGLGLYISKSIVEMHGGKISIDSDEGQGATVTFTVPCQKL